MKDLQEIDETRLKEAVQMLMSRNAKPYWEKFGSKVPKENEVLHFGWPGSISEDFLVTVAPRQCTTPLPHTHDFFVLSYCLEGEHSEIFEESQYELRAGDAYLLQPNVLHTVVHGKEDSGSVTLSIFIRWDFMHRYCLPLFKDNAPFSAFLVKAVVDKNSKEYLVFRGSKEPALRRLAACMLLDTVDETFSRRAILFSSLIKMLALLSKGMAEQEAPAVREKLTPEKILKYLSENYAAASLESAAQHFNYNPSYFSAYVKKETGRSFSEVLKQIRMERVAELIKNSDLTVSEAAALVGYTNMGNFYKMFRSWYGKTPRQFLQEQDRGSWQKGRPEESGREDEDNIL